MNIAETLIARGQLAMHPEGRWNVHGIPHQPEWGMSKSYSRCADRMGEALKATVQSANRCNKTPSYMGIELYEETTKITVIE